VPLELGEVCACVAIPDLADHVKGAGDDGAVLDLEGKDVPLVGGDPEERVCRLESGAPRLEAAVKGGGHQAPGVDAEAGHTHAVCRGDLLLGLVREGQERDGAVSVTRVHVCVADGDRECGGGGGEERHQGVGVRVPDAHPILLGSGHAGPKGGEGKYLAGVEADDGVAVASMEPVVLEEAVLAIGDLPDIEAVSQVQELELAGDPPPLCTPRTPQQGIICQLMPVAVDSSHRAECGDVQEGKDAIEDLIGQCPEELCCPEDTDQLTLEVTMTLCSQRDLSWSETIVRLNGRVCTILQQHPHNRQMGACTGISEWSGSLVTLRIRIGTMLQQHLHCLLMTIVRRSHEGSAARTTVAAVNFNLTMTQQSPCLKMMTIDRSTMQRRRRRGRRRRLGGGGCGRRSGRRRRGRRRSTTGCGVRIGLGVGVGDRDGRRG